MSTWKVPERIEKQKSHAFNKDVYLLGIDRDGQNIWLESPSWDCEWYWGFGYVETYQNNRIPSLARDIESHSHFDGLIWFKNEYNEYIYHINECPHFQSTVLTDNEAWELSDLMKQFYTLREAAEIFHRGNANYTASVKVNNKNEQMEKEINEVILPRIFARVIELLNPE